MTRSIIRLSATLALAMVACSDSPSGPNKQDVAAFEIRRGATLLYRWDGSVGAADTVRVAGADSIPVQFRWLDAQDVAVNISPNSADVAVTMSQPGIARWSSHPSDPFQGSFITADLLQPITTAFRVRLEINGEQAFQTALIPMNVMP
jgi:hypothetical protein